MAFPYALDIETWDWIRFSRLSATMKKKLLLTLLLLIVYFLHQDFWNWRQIGPLVFGCLPIGLAYHAAYTLLASATMAVLVKFAWPRELEEIEESAPPHPKDQPR